jgi:hypothetical protein
LFAILDLARDGLSVLLPKTLAEIVVLAILTAVTAAASAGLMVMERPRSRGLAVLVEALTAALVLGLNSAPVILLWWWGDAVWTSETAHLDALRDLLVPTTGRLSQLVLSVGYVVLALAAASYLRKFSPQRSGSFATHFLRSLVWTVALFVVSTGLFALWWLHAGAAGKLAGSGGLRPVALGVVGVWLVGLLIALFFTLVGWIIESRAARLRAATIATVVVALLAVLLLITDILPRAWTRDAAVMLLASLVGAWLWLVRDLARAGFAKFSSGPKQPQG